ncbi:hypothetical protein DL89DRAFT_264613 [Linderina pennispora]|uniref:Small RNA 2'-O-methyltransferase n=1 Tax=Linderina pennispora TaxID=61395 RepID=A0A1Y1WNW4_9FUNG|nr:uncharacterized protein DL89DRAFT_264613 [Linderina pennispora]ORX74824.1 hypothetical protein DL89DRAFT_264613 [Linderina pennispora]
MTTPEPYFFPPLWEQRRRHIADTLYAHKVQSVLEPRASLLNAKAQLLPGYMDKTEPRVDPLTITLYHGDGTIPICGLSADAVVCSEVIEHVYPDQVSALTQAVFGGYRPRLAVFTTPNAEFNVNFPNLHYGTPQAMFRDADHKFEWTRDEFRQWAQDCADTYGYDAGFVDVGRQMRNAAAGFVACGGCTQMAVFVRRTAPEQQYQHQDSGERCGQPPQLLESIEYPVFSGRRMAAKQLEALVEETARTEAMDGVFTLEQLWGRPKIQQQFKRRAALRVWVIGNQLFSQTDHDTFCLERRR